MARADRLRSHLIVSTAKIIGTALCTKVRITFSSSCVTWTLFRCARRTTTAARKAIITFARRTAAVLLAEVARTQTEAMFIARHGSIVIARVVRVTFLLQAEMVVMVQQEVLMATLTSKGQGVRAARR